MLRWVEFVVILIGFLADVTTYGSSAYANDWLGHWWARLIGPPRAPPRGEMRTGSAHARSGE